MTTLTLDTSGEVLVQRASSGGPFALHWSDLDPFTQGYVEALLQDAPAVGPLSDLHFHGFSDLHPEALAAILADCAKAMDDDAYQPTRDCGGDFWEDRQHGDYPISFPPLTASIGDDGKVRLS